MFHLTRRALKGIIALLALPVALHAKPVAATRSVAPQSNALSFIENIGQITDQHNNSRKDIDFKVSVPGMSIFVGDGQLHYQWSKTPPMPNDKRDMPGKMLRDEPLKDLPPTEMYRMDVTLVGANIKAPLAATEQQAYYERYFSSKFGEDGGLAHTYNRITYTNVYPNIDWVLYTKDGQLKYDFVVHPGGNPADIKLQYGGGAVALNKDGSVTATTPLGSITEQAPYTYIAESKVSVPSGYRLHGNTITFNVAKSDGTVVIDPALVWGTYYGGSNNESGGDVATDANSNCFLVGSTKSTSNIATTGAFQTIYVGSFYEDGFIVKLNSAGIRQWCTYYGDIDREVFESAACDAAGNIYVAGTTSGTGLATTGAHQTTNAGGEEVILIKFSTTGVRQWATYYGGTSQERSGSIVCDATGNIYVCGLTVSTSGIATVGAFQTTPSSGFLVKFDGTGMRQWGTYFAGLCDGVDVDDLGAVFICGMTQSTTGVATPGAHKTTISGSDAFFAKFNTANGTLIYGSYFGGASNEHNCQISCDATGNFYFGGFTTSTTGIATIGAHQATYAGGGSDCYLAKFNSNGVQQWGTYLGGAGYEDVSGLNVTASGKIYATGSTYSTSGIATSSGYQTNLGGASDLFLTQWSANGALLWSTYYGGQGIDHIQRTVSGAHRYGGLDVSAAGYIYLTGNTNSITSIATAGAHQTTIVGSTTFNDAFVVQFVQDTIPSVKQPFIDTSLCPGNSLYVRYEVTENFKTNNTFTVQLSDAAGGFDTPVNIGAKTANTADSILCKIPLTAPIGTGYRLRIVSSAPVRISNNNGVNIRIKTGPANLNASSNAPICETYPIQLNATATSAFPITWKWGGPNGFTANAQNPTPFIAIPAAAGSYFVTATAEGCSNSDTVSVALTLAPPIGAYASPNDTICGGETVTLVAVVANANTSTLYEWYKNTALVPGGNTALITDANVQTGDRYYCRTTITGVCQVPIIKNTDTIKMTVHDVLVTPSVSITSVPIQPLPGQLAAFTAAPVHPGYLPQYQWLRNGQKVIGALSANWSAGYLHPYDEINCMMISNDKCASVDTVYSNKIVVNFPTSISSVGSNGNNTISLYPNPNNGNFTITGNIDATGVAGIEIVNAVGQLVYRDNAEISNNQINKQVTLNANSLANGVYLLKINANGVSNNIRFTINR